MGKEGLPSIWREFDGRQDTFSWTRTEGATKFINELLQAPQIAVGSLAAIDMKTTLQRDELVTTSTLVVPSGTRGAWHALLCHAKESVEGQRFLVIGSPGVGKSRSLNYLIREIIKRHRAKGALPPAIVFEHRMQGQVWLFVPKDRENPQSDYEAYWMSLDDFFASGAAVLYDARNYYIIDGKAERTYTPTLVSCKTIFTCLPIYQHYSEYAKHLQQGGTYYVPVWKEQEILDAIPFMVGETDIKRLLGKDPHDRQELSTQDDSKITQQQRLKETVQRRLSEVGAIPRIVFSNSTEYKAYKGRLYTVITHRQDEVMEMMAWESGTLEVGVAVDVDVDPETQALDYQSCVVRLASDYVRFRLSLESVQMMYDHMLLRARGVERQYYYRKSFAYEFERMAVLLLKSGWETTVQEITPGDQAWGLCVKEGGDETLAEPGMRTRAYEVAKNMPKVTLLTTSSSSSSSGSPLPLQTGSAAPVFVASEFPVVDALDACNRGFRVAMCQRKHMSDEKLTELRAGLGLKEEDLHIVELSLAGVPWVGGPPLPRKPVRLYRADVPSPHANPALWSRVLNGGKARRQFSSLARLLTRLI